MKKFIIMVGRHGRPSTKELFKNISKQNCEHVIKSAVFDGFVVRDTPNNMKSKKKVKSGDTYNCSNSIVIRWGWYGNMQTNDQTIVYNSAEAIKLANDKGKCRKHLAARGIDVPETYLLDEIKRMTNVEYPLIARPSHHGRGKHLWVCNNQKELNIAIGKGASYFSKIYPKTEEYRVHCGLGKILEVMRKPAPADPSQVAWNRALNDAPFERIPWNNWENFICKLALRAAREMNLQLAGVDIMVQRTNDNIPKAVVCEINTAPTLNSSPHVLERYSKLFNKIARSETRIEPWDFESFESANSLAWKEIQLAE